jgi:hypothetical protein
MWSFLSGIACGLIFGISIPEKINKIMAYLLIAIIGLKGGHTIVCDAQLSWDVFFIMTFGLFMSFTIPFAAYGFLRITTSLDNITAAALSAHYGSVSIVTFVAASDFLRMQSVCYPGYFVALMALMEFPALISAFLLARADKINIVALSSIASHKTLAILLLSFVFGMVLNDQLHAIVQTVYAPIFKVTLLLFLFGMGLVVARQKSSLKDFSLPLLSFGIYMPLICAACALIFSMITHLPVGAGTMLMVLCASASYIAIPAAVRVSLPQARASIYLPMVLGVTFPFNIIFGIPFYYACANFFLR